MAARWGRSGGRPRRTPPRPARSSREPGAGRARTPTRCPRSRQAHAERPEDESLLADLLRSEAVVRGPGAALERYERYRRDLRERLGASPGERLQRMHRDLLALDRPERTGVRYDPTPLLGRDGDIDALRALIASSRVVSIVGPGGLGKTRLAHVLARDATQPVVHVVELVGVTAADDVVAEVGSVLGVRDSISGRRTLTPEQRADVRARVAQRLGQSPSLLVLDNCEHLVGAVAELVAFLVSTTADLRVLTTSRAPLAIAAERVYLLGELDVDDAVRLFRERAIAARPGVRLADDVVRRIVVRLDGLPLAIELAAAKVRAIAVEEIDRRLEDRFALLRGGDRSAPDRHRTLLAVIDWSWNLLDPDERRALRRLALFNDGFMLEAADAVLGDGALEALQGLVNQSLLSVRETTAGLRYRMLETVREFGRMQLATAGEDAEARAARRRWATGYARRHGARLMGREQFAAIDAVGVEEINLADELRDAIDDGDLGPLVELLAGLGMLWTVRGEHARLFALAGAVAQAIGGWSPPPELEDAARAALVITLSNTMVTVDEHSGPIRALLARLGPGTGDSRIAGVVRVLLAFDADRADGFEARLEQLAQEPDPAVAGPAGQWLSHVRENAGDPAGAVAAAERALARVDDEAGPWSDGDAPHPARAADDAPRRPRSSRGARPSCAAGDGASRRDRRRGAAAVAARPVRHRRRATWRTPRPSWSGSTGSTTARCSAGSRSAEIGAAELALARGDRAGGLRAYRESAEAMRALRFPGIGATGLEPWVLFGESTALTAHAHYAAAPTGRRAGSSFAPAAIARCATSRRRIRNSTSRWPGWCCSASAPGACFAARRRPTTPCGCSSWPSGSPTTARSRRWRGSGSSPRAEERAPGRIAAWAAGYGDRRPHDLLDEARALIEQLTA